MQMTSDSITLEVKLHAFVRRDTRRRWIAVCPSLGVASQGTSEENARRSLHEAVELWFESCVERGVLDEALREANFRPSGPATPSNDRSKNAEGEDILGERFDIHVAIPAYYAPIFAG